MFRQPSASTFSTERLASKEGEGRRFNIFYAQRCESVANLRFEKNKMDAFSLPLRQK